MWMERKREIEEELKDILDIILRGKVTSRDHIKISCSPMTDPIFEPIRSILNEHLRLVEEEELPKGLEGRIDAFYDYATGNLDHILVGRIVETDGDRFYLGIRHSIQTNEFSPSLKLDVWPSDRYLPSIPPNHRGHNLPLALNGDWLVPFVQQLGISPNYFS